MENIEKKFIKQASELEQSKESQEINLVDQVKETIRKEGPHLSTFAGDSSLKYNPSFEAKTFSFNHVDNEIIVPVQWFLDKEYSPDGLRFAFYHELSHFIDMRNDPESYIENFEYKKRGKANQDICSWLESKLEKDGVEQEKIDILKNKKGDKKGTGMDDLQVMAYQYLHTMFNILDDISVNNLVMQKAPVYSGEEGRKEVENIYKKLGFENNDFRGKPKHVQFIYSLIREEMLRDSEDNILDDEVGETINNKKIYGKTVKQIIEKLKPKAGNLPEAGERYKYIKQYIMPIYLKFLKEDIENLDFKQIEEEAEKQKQESGEGREKGEPKSGGKEDEENSEQQEGSEEEGDGEGSEKGDESSEEDQQGSGSEGEGSEEGQESEKREDEENSEQQEGSEEEGDGEGSEKGDESSEESKKEGGHEAGGDFDFNPFKKYHENPKDPDEMMTEEEIEKMLEKFMEDKKYADMMPEERAKAIQEKLQAEFDEKYKISSETRELFEKRMREIREPRKEMRNFWKKLIGESIQLIRKKVRKQNRGNLTIEDFIDRYADIKAGEKVGKLGKLNIYEKYTSKLENVNQPERIEVSLVCDMSGSMKNDSTKIEALQKTVSLLLLSIKDFNSYLDQSRRETKTKLSVYSEVYVFGDSFKRVKQFRNEHQGEKQEKNDAEIIKIFDYLQDTIGSTNNAAVLNEILKSVDRKKEIDIKKGKVKKIVFEITDGQPDPDLVEDTKNRVNDMLDKNIIPIAFQIGNVMEEQKITFEYIWNKHKGSPQLGYLIGEEIDQLPEKLMGSLKQKFRNIKL